MDSFRFDLLKQSPEDWQELNPNRLAGSSGDPHRHGSKIVFEGLVRSINQNKQVVDLFYEGFEAMVLKEGNAILKSVLFSYRLLSVSAFHRLGLLKLGEVAVRVVVFSEHRQAGFDATQEIMSQIKQRLPIWKKERYSDGSREWIYCQHVASH